MFAGWLLALTVFDKSDSPADLTKSGRHDEWNLLGGQTFQAAPAGIVVAERRHGIAKEFRTYPAALRNGLFSNNQFEYVLLNFDT
jgi:hypothetical protein